MNRTRIQRLEKLAAGRICPRCGQPLRPTRDEQEPACELSAEHARELERLVRGALRPCTCGRLTVDLNSLTVRQLPLCAQNDKDGIATVCTRKKPE